MVLIKQLRRTFSRKDVSHNLPVPVTRLMTKFLQLSVGLASVMLKSAVKHKAHRNDNAITLWGIAWAGREQSCVFTARPTQLLIWDPGQPDPVVGSPACGRQVETRWSPI